MSTSMGAFAKEFKEQTQDASKAKFNPAHIKTVKELLADNVALYIKNDVGITSDERLLQLPKLLRSEFTDLDREQFQTLEKIASIVANKEIKNKEIVDEFIKENALNIYVLRLAVGRELETKYRTLSDLSRKAASNSRDLRKGLGSLMDKKELNSEIKDKIRTSLFAIRDMQKEGRPPSEDAVKYLRDLKETIEHVADTYQGKSPELAEIATTLLQNWSEEADYLTDHTAVHFCERDEGKHFSTSDPENERDALIDLHNKLGL